MVQHVVRNGGAQMLIEGFSPPSVREIAAAVGRRGLDLLMAWVKMAGTTPPLTGYPEIDERILDLYYGYPRDYD
jgi:hypothetical protein